MPRLDRHKHVSRTYPLQVQHLAVAVHRDAHVPDHHVRENLIQRVSAQRTSCRVDASRHWRQHTRRSSNSAIPLIRRGMCAGALPFCLLSCQIRAVRYSLRVPCEGAPFSPVETRAGKLSLQPEALGAGQEATNWRG